METKFKREIKSLEQVFDFISRFVKANGLDESISYVLNLAVEELFTNMVKYNTESSNDILISLEKIRKNLVCSLTDFDVDPFDPTRSKDVDVEAHIEERRVGGLGIHLVKQMVDKIDYEYKDRQSKITLVKKLES